ncbi:helix-turn-helix transcriptional regulator [Paraburkholderia sp. RL18-101-BIB-B]|uniref:helix-turn-helix domain-containing protein n=1 Tax=Paraburkholderia sp. RL18-101-BIB-B TaxID=3031634 RepID=UPI0038BD0418
MSASVGVCVVYVNVYKTDAYNVHVYNAPAVDIGLVDRKIGFLFFRDGLMSLQERFVQNLRRYRVSLGCSQEELGNRLGSDRTVISRYERTSSRMTLERADALARGLDIDVRVLLDTPSDKDIIRVQPGTPVSSETVGEKVRQLRQAEGITQKDLGNRTGMDRNRISQIEASSGKVAALQLSTLERLAAAFGVKPTELF